MSHIELHDVSFAYPGGYSAVEDVSLAIAPGENIAVIGQNGAGKTTLVKMLNGLIRPTRGRVLVDNRDTRNHTTAQLSRVVGYVFQNPDDQIFHATVMDEVGFGPKILKTEPAKKNRLIEDALALAGLTQVTAVHPYDLPLSQRKFVTIAAVLAMDCPVVVLDEPTAGQDMAGLKRLAHILDSLHANGKTVITITHDMDFAAAHFDRVIVMAKKKIVADGLPREIFWDMAALEKAGLRQPHISRLARRLGLPGEILYMDELVARLLEP